MVLPALFFAGAASIGALALRRRRRRRGEGGDASPPSSEKRSDARVPFVDRTRVPASAPSPGAAVRPLEGLKYAVKDVFAIEGRVASFGSPAWRATHDPATTAARAVTLCADAGAVGVGVAAADELGFGVTARSSSAPRGAPTRRIPGGRSGGGAVAVASRAAGVDFALGTDASGGVRVPAALAGCYGFRPTQGAVSASGVTRHAPSMDTVGWFARDPETLAKVGEALMDKAPRTPTNSELPTSLLVVEDALDAGDKNAACAVGAACGALGERFAKVTRATGEGGISRINLGAHLLKICPSLREVARALSPETEERSAGLAALRECHRLLVAAEAWKEIGPWYRACDAATNAAITPRARELLEACAAIEPESLATIRRAREEARVAVGLLLDGTGAALVFPTTPGATPGAAKKAKDDDDEDGNGGEVRRVNEDEEAAAMETWREKCSRLVCVCDLVGFPQVTIPMPREGGGAGVGLSFVVGPRRDFSALAIAQQWGAKIAEAFPAIVQNELALERRKTQTPPSSGANGAAAAAAAAAAAGSGDSAPGEALKARGNAAFKAGEHAEAVKLYTAALDKGGNARWRSIVLSNRAMANLKVGSYAEAEEDCTKALEGDPKNVKALLRRGAARSVSGNYLESLEDYEAALRLEPKNKDARAEIERMKNILGEATPIPDFD